MKAERNQDGTFTLRVTEKELFMLERACWDRSGRLILERPHMPMHEVEELQALDELEAELRALHFVTVEICNAILGEVIPERLAA